MAAKSFKGYGAMWSSPNEPREEDNKKAHNKNKKQTPKKEEIEANLINIQDDNIKTPNNTFILENKETPVKKKGRGRPKMDTTEKKTHFNLLLRPATITALNTIAGRMQAETGKRVTVTGLITKLIDEFVAKQGE